MQEEVSRRIQAQAESWKIEQARRRLLKTRVFQQVIDFKETSLEEKQRLELDRAKLKYAERIKNLEDKLKSYDLMRSIKFILLYISHAPRS